MKRSWAVRPDQELLLTDGRVIEVVSDAAQQQAVCEAQVIQSRIGGYFFTAPSRVPTELPGEMVTVFYTVTWQDRTDAKAQPEQQVAAFVPETPKAEMVTGGTDLEAAEALAEDLAAYAEIRVEGGSMAPEDGALIDPADGFDYSQLEAEDIENEPAAT